MSQSPMQLVEFLVNHLPENLRAFLGVALAFAAFWSIGRLCLGGASAAATLFGWGLVYLLSLLLTLCGLQNLLWLAGLCLALAAYSLWVRRPRYLADDSVLPSMLILLPLAALAALMPLLHWDSYWHWALNGSYLYRFDRFPAVPLESFPSYHPTYPAAMSLVYYFASLVTGRFAESAGTFTNLMLSLIAMQAVIPLLREAIPQRSTPLLRYVVPVLAFCCVVSLNPGFRPINYFSAIADPALGVIVMVVLIYWCAYIAAERPVKKDLLLLFMLGVLIGGVKHSGWVLAGVLSAAGIFVGVVRHIPWPRWLAPAVAVPAGALLAQILWGAYLSAHLPLPGQFSIQALSQWRFDLAAGLFAGILRETMRAPFYYGMVLLTIIAGFYGLWRAAFFKNERLALLLSFVAVALPVHFASLIAAYLGTGFYVPEILRAASLHRYSSHIGFGACAFGLLAFVSLAAPYIRSRLAKVGRTPQALMILALFAIPLAYNILLPTVRSGAQYLKNYAALRASAALVAEMIPADETLVIFASEWGTNLAGYESWRPAQAVHGPLLRGKKIVASAADFPAARELFADWMADEAIDHIWLFDAQILNAELGLDDAFSTVWSRSSGRWRVIERERRDFRDLLARAGKLKGD